MSPKALRLSGVVAGYGGDSVLRGIDLAVADGESVAVLGPSGCGKTTLLRVVAGLTAPSAGTVEIGGVVVDGGGKRVPPERRGAALVFQDLALWPHRSVAGNLDLVMEAAGVASAEREQTARDLIASVGLPRELLDRRPGELSGGERQRAALARALAQQPRVLLLDEPLTGLDRPLRRTLVRALSDLRRRRGLATLLVTHDHEAAFSLADRVVVLESGSVAQEGTPEAVHDRPVSAFVAAFVGASTLLPVTVDGDRAHTALGTYPVRHAPSGPLVAVFRPARVRITADGGTRGRVVSCTYRGGDWLADVAVPPGVDAAGVGGGQEERVLAVSDHELEAGANVRVTAATPALVPAGGVRPESEAGR